MRYLQDALTLAGSNPTISEVHLAAGIYHPDRNELSPDGAGDRQMSFVVPSGVMVMGSTSSRLGFAFWRAEAARIAPLSAQFIDPFLSVG